MNKLDYYIAMKNDEKQARQDALNRFAGFQNYQASIENNLFRLFLIRVAIFSAVAIPTALYLLTLLTDGI